MAGLVPAGKEGAEHHRRYPLPAWFPMDSVTASSNNISSQPMGAMRAMKVGKDVLVGAGATLR